MADSPTNPTAGECAKRSISAPSELFAAADQVMARRHIGNFSEYVRELIRRDLEKKAEPVADEVAA